MVSTSPARTLDNSRAQVTGRVGVPLESRRGQARGIATIALGDARRREVSTATFYSVSRLKREFADQSSLGVI